MQRLLLLFSSFPIALLLIYLTDYAETPPPMPKVEPPEAPPVVTEWDVQTFFPHEE